VVVNAQPYRQEIPIEIYSDSAIVNEIRGHVDAWRDLPGGADWGVTPTTQRLLEHWRSPNFSGQRPFFCQIEAVETLIWLTEVARSRRQYANLWRSVDAANADSLFWKSPGGGGDTVKINLPTQRLSYRYLGRLQAFTTFPI
jgi:hypothetical protein